MNKEKKIYYSDLTTLVEVCYSCSSQNIHHELKKDSNGYIESDYNKSFCNDCNSEDVGAVFPEEVIWKLKI